MLRLLQIIVLIIVGNVINSRQAVAVEQQVVAAASIESTHTRDEAPHDMGSFMAVEPQPATLGGERNNVRTITARSFRTTSSNGANSWRCSGGSACNTYNNLLTSKRRTDALRIESAPFPFSCPCDYYVFALRRIIC